MDLISYFVALFAYLVFFNTVVLLPAAILLGLLKEKLVPVLGEDGSLLLLSAPFFVLCLVPIWLANRAAQKVALDHRGAVDAVTAVLAEARAALRGAWVHHRLP